MADEDHYRAAYMIPEMRCVLLSTTPVSSRHRWDCNQEGERVTRRPCAGPHIAELHEISSAVLRPTAAPPTLTTPQHFAALPAGRQEKPMTLRVSALVLLCGLLATVAGAQERATLYQVSSAECRSV
jgi:hypothetical protein